MNEREIASGFSGAWAEHFPMLSPTFIIAFNEAFVRPIFGRNGIVQPVENQDGTSYPDVLAEFAFQLAAIAFDKKVPVRAVAADPSELANANLVAAERVRRFRPNLTLDELRIAESGQNEGARLASAYEEFHSLWPSERATFLPEIRGNGVLSSCFADLSIGKSLFEVKTVSRPFQSKDLRQLLVYLALQSATGERRWEDGGLFNPRRGVYAHFSIDWLVTRLSGGRPTKIVFSEFLQSCNRDVVLDRHF
jgi:hypothetical protein